MFQGPIKALSASRWTPLTDAASTSAIMRIIAAIANIVLARLFRATSSLNHRLGAGDPR